MITQERYERLVELMNQKGVKHEAFEILADLRSSEISNHSESNDKMNNADKFCRCF